GDLRKPVQQNDKGPIRPVGRALEPRFEHVDVEAVHVAHKARADAGRQNGWIERGHCGARGRGWAGAADATQSAGNGIPAVFASSRGSFSRRAPRFAKKTNPIRLLRVPAPGRLTGVMIMANDQMTA